MGPSMDDPFDAGGSAGQAGAPPVESVPTTNTGPSFEVTVGRLPAEAHLCWVRADGTATDSEWESRRAMFQELISSWQGRSGLTMQWDDPCSPPGMGRTEDVRILLDDRTSLGKSIPGCDQKDQSGPWAVYPVESANYASCAWNMVLPIDLVAPRAVLHTAGHALGFSHEHLRATSPAPLCPDPLAVDPTSPYLSAYDPLSVMHYGYSKETAFTGSPWSECPDLELGGLTQGDRLAMEMLYPSASSVQLGPTGWLWFEGVKVFPAGESLHLANAWTTRGASHDWFRQYVWTVTRPDNANPEIFLQLELELPAADDSTLYIGHAFIDPFGDEHALSEQIQVSDRKFAAVLTSLL